MLKPCIICGSTKIYSEKSINNFFAVFCASCGHSVTSEIEEAEEKAIEKWNSETKTENDISFDAINILKIYIQKIEERISLLEKNNKELESAVKNIIRSCLKSSVPVSRIVDLENRINFLELKTIFNRDEEEGV